MVGGKGIVTLAKKNVRTQKVPNAVASLILESSDAVFNSQLRGITDE